MATKDTKARFSLIDGVSTKIKAISERIADLATRLGKLTRLGSAVTAALGAVSTVGIFTKAVASASKFEDALVAVRAATRATEGDLAALDDAIRAASAESGLPYEQVAEAFTLLGREGAGAKEAIQQIGPTLALAQANAIPVAEAVGIVSASLDQFGRSAGEAAATVDVLQATTVAGGTSIQQVAAAMANAGPIAKQAGISFEEAAAAIAQLATAGIEGGKAGAGLKTVFEELANPASKFTAAVRSLGIDTSSLGSILAGIQSKGAAGTAALQLLGDRGATAMRALINAGGPALDALTAKLENAQGEATRTAEIFRDKLSTAFQNFQNALAEVAADFGQPLLDPLKEGLNDIAAKLREVSQTEAFNDLAKQVAGFVDEAVKDITEWIGAFNFEAAATNASNFIDSIKTGFATAGSIASIGADTVRAAVAGIEASFGGLRTTALTLELTLAKIELLGLRTQAAFTPALEQFIPAAERAVAALEDELGRAIDDTSNAIDRFNTHTSSASTTLSRLDERTRAAAAGNQQLATAQAEVATQATTAATALDRSTEAADRNAKANQTAVRTTAAIIAELNKVNAQIATLALEGASQTDIAPLVAQVKALEAELAKASGSAGNLASGLEQVTDKKEKIEATANATERTGDAMEKAADSAKDVGDNTAAGAEKAGAAVGGLLELFNGLQNRFASVSENALKMFLRFQEAEAKTATSVLTFADAVSDAAAATERALADQQSQAETTISTMDALAADSTASLEQVQRAAGGTSETLREMAGAARTADSAMDILDQQTLDNVAASIERAADRMAQLEERAQSAVEQLRRMREQAQDDADRAAGNEEAIAQRELDRKIREIRELSSVAGRAGQAEASALEALAREAHQRRLREIQERRDAERRAREERAADERRRREDDDGEGATVTSNRPRPANSGGGITIQMMPGSVVLNNNGLTPQQLGTEASQSLVRGLHRELGKIDRLRR